MLHIRILYRGHAERKSETKFPRRLNVRSLGLGLHRRGLQIAIKNDEGVFHRNSVFRTREKIYQINNIIIVVYSVRRVEKQ